MYRFVLSDQTGCRMVVRPVCSLESLPKDTSEAGGGANRRKEKPMSRESGKRFLCGKEKAFLKLQPVGTGKKAASLCLTPGPSPVPAGYRLCAWPCLRPPGCWLFRPSPAGQTLGCGMQGTVPRIVVPRSSWNRGLPTPPRSPVPGQFLVQQMSPKSRWSLQVRRPRRQVPGGVVRSTAACCVAVTARLEWEASCDCFCHPGALGN